MNKMLVSVLLEIGCLTVLSEYKNKIECSWQIISNDRIRQVKGYNGWETI